MAKFFFYKFNFYLNKFKKKKLRCIEINNYLFFLNNKNNMRQKTFYKNQ